MADIGRVGLRFDADPSGLMAGVNAASSSLKKLEASAASTSRSLAALTALKGIEVVGAAFTKIGSAALGIGQSLRAMAEEQVRVVDSQAAMAARVGMTFKELSGLGYAAQLANVSIDTVVASSNRLDVALSNLQEGSAGAVAAFARLGLSADSFAGQGAAKRFETVASAIAGIEDSMDRSAAAMRIFGRGGAELLPLFSEGAGYIANMSREAERLGLALNDNQAGSIAAMSDAFERANLAITGVVRQVVSVLAPAVQGVVDQFTKFIVDADGAEIGKQIGTGLLDGARVLADVADGFVVQATEMWRQASEVGVGFADVVSGLRFVFNLFSGTFSVVKNAVTGLGEGILWAMSGVNRLLSPFLKQVFALVEFLRSGSFEKANQAAESYVRQSKAIQDSFADSALKSFGKVGTTLSGAVDYAFGGEKVEKAVAGPFRAALEKGIATAGDLTSKVTVKVSDQNAKRAEAAAKAMADLMAAKLEASLKQVRGIDSRSQEGIDAFFRWQRGDAGGGVQMQQLEELRGIRQAIEEPDDAVLVEMN